MLRRGVVLACALVYWAGVWVQIRRVRRHIGRAPNVRPEGAKERCLWAGWMAVVAGWLALPWIARGPDHGGILALWPTALHSAGLIVGLAVVVVGQAATFWCYSIMGDTWRMGLDRQEKTKLVTRGPYARIRHPIYAFQVLILAGVVLLLPTALSAAIWLVHLLCVWIKAQDEEAHLLRLHGDDYRNYVTRTGRLWPRLFWDNSSRG